MQTLSLNATARTIGNKQSLKQLRRNEEVPGVIYGHGMENVNFAISAKEL